MKQILKWIIAIPIILVVLGMLDLGKAVVSNDEKEIKSATKMLTKRAIFAVSIFFVIAIVQLVFSLFASSGNDDKVGDWKSCLDCLTHNNATCGGTEEGVPAP